MLVKTLSAVSKICSRISNPSSLQGLYRAIEIGTDGIKCVSEFGNLSIQLDATGLTEACLLDTTSVMAVANSLPQDTDIQIIKNGNKVDWKCGEAKGHLNLIQTDHKIPELAHKNFPWIPDKNLPDALRLASCACQAAAVSVGLYGITLEVNGDNLRILSSNSISLASTSIPKGGFPVQKITIRPPVPAVLALFLQSCPNCAIDITDEGIFILGDWLSAHLPLGIELEHDLIEIADKFQEQKQVAKISSPAVKKFITRARALSDRNISFTVGLKVEQGKLVLTHKGLASSTEEYFLSEGLQTDLSYAAVEIPAEMLALPLEHVQHCVLDYLGEQRLVLKGENPEFVYVISGGD